MENMRNRGICNQPDLEYGNSKGKKTQFLQQTTWKKYKVGGVENTLLQIKMYGPYLDPSLNRSTPKEKTHKNTTVINLHMDWLLE